MEPEGYRTEEIDDKTLIQQFITEVNIHWSAAKRARTIPGLGQGHHTEPVEFYPPIGQACPLVMDERKDREQERVTGQGGDMLFRKDRIA